MSRERTEAIGSSYVRCDCGQMRSRLQFQQNPTCPHCGRRARFFSTADRHE